VFLMLFVREMLFTPVFYEHCFVVVMDYLNIVGLHRDNHVWRPRKRKTDFSSVIIST